MATSNHLLWINVLIVGIALWTSWDLFSGLRSQSPPAADPCVEFAPDLRQAKSDMMLGNFKKVVVSLEVLIADTQGKCDRLKPEILVLRARALHQLEDFKSEVIMLREAVPLFEQQHGKTELRTGDILLSLATAMGLARDPQPRFDILERAARCFAKAPAPGRDATWHYELALAHGDAGDYAKMLEQLDKAESTAAGSDPILQYQILWQRAEALRNSVLQLMGLAATEAANARLAVLDKLIALDTSVIANPRIRKRRWELQHEQAVTYGVLGQHNRSSDLFGKVSCALIDEMGNETTASVIPVLVKHAAAEHSKKHGKWHEICGHTGLALARALKDAKKDSERLKEIESAKEVFEQKYNLDGSRESRIMLAKAYRELGDALRAVAGGVRQKHHMGLQHIKRSLALFEQSGTLESTDPELIATLLMLADAHSDLDQLGDAHSAAARAVEIAEKRHQGSDHPELIEPLRKLAAVNGYEKNFQLQLQHIRRAVKIAQSQQMDPATVLIPLQELLAVAYGDLGKPDLKAVAEREAARLRKVHNQIQPGVMTTVFGAMQKPVKWLSTLGKREGPAPTLRTVLQC